MFLLALLDAFCLLVPLFFEKKKSINFQANEKSMSVQTCLCVAFTTGFTRCSKREAQRGFEVHLEIVDFEGWTLPPHQVVKRLLRATPAR